MASTHWRFCRPVDPQCQYLVLLSFLPLRRRWRIPVVAPQNVQDHETAAALCGIGRLFPPREARSRAFWTLSVWEDEAALQAFVHAEPHRGTMRVLLPHMGPTRFVRWTVFGTGLPILWDDALKR